MIWRATKIFLLLVLVAAIAGFTSGNLGIVRVTWLGYLFETSVPVAAALFWALVEFVRLILLAISAPFGKGRIDDE